MIFCIIINKIQNNEKLLGLPLIFPFMRRRLGALLLAASMFVTASAIPIDRAEARRIVRALMVINDTTSDEMPPMPYYVFSRGAGRGFVIVSGDESTVPVLGYTDEGDFDYNALPVQLQQMLSAWGERIRNLQATAPQQATKSKRTAKRRFVESFKATWTDVSPLIETHWHQNHPYNSLCPQAPNESGQRAATGCLATAGAQIAYYFRRDMPAALQYDTPIYTLNWGHDWGNYPVSESYPAGTPVEYDKMLLNYTGEESDEARRAVALLMFAMGASARQNYGPTTGGQVVEQSKALATQFLLNNDHHFKSQFTQDEWERLVYQSLSTRRPVLYTGLSAQNGSHATIIDGYQASTGLYHFNFGWGGAGDGYYTIDDETGMNGYRSQQSACLMLTPAKQHLEAAIEPPTLYSQTEGQITVTVQNLGTLDYKGIYLYINTRRASLPTIPNRINDYRTISAGKTMTFTFDYKPTVSEGTIWLFVTDKQKNLLDSCHVQVLPGNPTNIDSRQLDVSGKQQVYDLQGRPVSSPKSRNLYIVNGRKKVLR